jgi:hypothetical protein
VIPYFCVVTAVFVLQNAFKLILSKRLSWSKKSVLWYSSLIVDILATPPQCRTVSICMSILWTQVVRLIQEKELYRVPECNLRQKYWLQDGSSAKRIKVNSPIGRFSERCFSYLAPFIFLTWYNTFCLCCGNLFSSGSMPSSCEISPNVATKWFALLLCIQGLPGSDLGPETEYPGWSSWFVSVPPGKCRDSTLN